MNYLLASCALLGAGLVLAEVGRRFGEWLGCQARRRSNEYRGLPDSS